MTIRLRTLARELKMAEDDVVLWLLEHAPELVEIPHPADHLSDELAARVRAARHRPELEHLELRCDECLRSPAPPGVRAVAAGGDRCARCGDSVIKREALALVAAFAEKGLRRLLVVGGGPGTAEELRAQLGEAIELRIVDGERSRDATQAGAELAWADVVAIWGSTILPHRVSKLYTDRRADYREKLVTVPLRGAAALCRAAAEKARTR